MYILKIKLNEKEYGLSTIKASAIKKIIAFQKKNAILQAQAQAENVDTTEQILDMMVDFLVSIYENQFTNEDVWNGLALSELQPEFDKTIEAVMSAFNIDNKKK